MMICIGRILWLSATTVTFFVGTLVLKSSFVAGSSQCSEYDFPCEDGGCVDSALWCDSSEDCGDGSDEKYCRKANKWNKDPNYCPSNYFKCNNGPCIPMVGRCDGYESCEDSSDEKNCGDRSSDPKTTLNYLLPTAPPTRNFEGSNAIQFFASLNASENSIQLGQFSGVPAADFVNQRKKARNWLLSQRKRDYGWGDETPRALAALFLYDEQPMLRNTESGMLMIKQLEIQLSLELSRNSSRPMKLTDLALYINALLLTCKNPKNFYGDNLVQMLRNGVDNAQREDTFINPSVYLTLCTNNATTYDDAKMLQDIFSSHNDTISRINMQALGLLTASCMFRKTDFLNDTTYDGIKMEFLRTLKVHGFPGNVYEATLLAQALQEIKVSLRGSTDFILRQQQAVGSFGDILVTYLALPVLTGRNLIPKNDHCGQQSVSDLIPLEVLKNVKGKKMHVQYSLNYGYPPEVAQTIHLHVAEGTNLLDVMRLAQDITSKYRFKLNENRKLPIVFSIGDMPNDVEKGMYWRPYEAVGNGSEVTNDKHWVPYTGDIKKFILADGDKVLFWYRPL